MSRLPYSMKVLLENLLRFEDGTTVTRDDLQAMADWLKERRINREIQYRPARVLMQDFTGVPAVVDLAAMRDAMRQLGGDPQKINPLVPVHLVIDHSVMVDEFGNPRAFEKNVEFEYERNGERYEFLKWGSQAFDNFKVVPPGTGICHQVNLEHISAVRMDRQGSDRRDAGLSRYIGRDRQPHDDGQWPRRARLGRRRNRGRSSDARPAGQHAHPRSGRVPAFGPAQRRDYRDRPGADSHPDASAEGRGRPLRRILRAGPRQPAARRPRDHRQHGAGIWRDLRLLPDRRAHHRLSRADRPRRASDRAGAGLCPGAGPVARRVVARAAVHRHARTRHEQHRAVARRARSGRRTECC